MIMRFEGWSPTAYFNNGDVPTIGYGVAFLFEGQSGYEARTLAELNDWFSGIYTFTQAEHDALVDIADELNLGHPSTAMQLFNGWGPAAALSLSVAEGETVLGRAIVDVTANAIPQNIVTGLAGSRELGRGLISAEP